MSDINANNHMKWDNGMRKTDTTNRIQGEKPKSSFEDFSKHCSKLLENSLITGFPTLVSTTNSFRFFFKVFVLITSTIGFIYQTWTFLILFYSYPTTLNMEYLVPETFSAPAITVCNANRLILGQMCKAFPDRCIAAVRNETFSCRKNPICDKDPHRYDKIFHTFGYNFSNEVIDTFGPQSEKEFLDFCFLAKKECTNKFYFQARDAVGLPYKCLSIGSIWGMAEKEPTQVTKSDVYDFQLDVRPKEYLMFHLSKQAYLYVHDPYTMVNPIADGLTLRAGFEYGFHVRIEKTEYLPAPYKTNCTDYLKEWKKNGGRGPTTRKECFEICELQLMIEKFGCVDRFISYPNSHENCVVYERPTEEMKEICYHNCSEACESTSYVVTVKKDDVTNNCYLWDDCGIIDIKISFSRMSVTKFKHEPKFESVELFSYIGGYMGMWLGISLVSLFDLAEMLFDLSIYPLKKKIRDSKNVIRVM